MAGTPIKGFHLWTEYAVPIAFVGVGLVAFYVWKKGGIAGAASAVGAGAVNAAGGAVSGGVGAIGASVGLPTPDQTTTSPAVARWLIDNIGHGFASQWAGAMAYAKALFMEAGSGTPPTAGSDLGRAAAAAIAAERNASAPDTGDETARLAARYPAPLGQFSPESIFSGSGSFSQGAGFGFGTIDGGPVFVSGGG